MDQYFGAVTGLHGGPYFFCYVECFSAGAHVYQYNQVSLFVYQDEVVKLISLFLILLLRNL